MEGKVKKFTITIHKSITNWLYVLLFYVYGYGFVIVYFNILYFMFVALYLLACIQQRLL